METTVSVTLFSSPFAKASVFTCPHWVETERVQNSAFWEDSTFETIFEEVLVWTVRENAWKTHFNKNILVCSRS